jgi:hypothetical protein
MASDGNECAGNFVPVFAKAQISSGHGDIRFQPADPYAAVGARMKM